MQYDEFQIKAIDSINKGNSVIVSAPTGSGKTAIAEHLLTQAIAANKEVVYTAPIKALSNQKFRDFTRIYKNHIGILTGDVSLNIDAPVLIMTTEIFRNSLLENPQRFANVSWVIFDEVHYLDDPERGTVWEESIIFCPDQIRILALSATIPNVHEISSWIQKIHKHTIDSVIEEKRPVPLQHMFQANNQIFTDLNQLKKNVYHAIHGRRDFHQRTKKFPQNRIHDLIAHLKTGNSFPAIYFCFSRKRCESLAEENTGFDFISPQEKEALSLKFIELLKKYELENEPSAKKLWPLIRRGIAYHHAGLLPSLKEVIEQLFTSRLIKLIFTTETFALGINMPAKTVIFDELKKFYGMNFTSLRCRDYYQMAGRAGRRGIDKIGFVYSRINPLRISFEQIRRTLTGQPEPVLSQFNLSYASLLHLYRKWQERLYDIYPLSLHFHQASKNIRENAIDLMKVKIRLLEELNYIEQSRLTFKGEFACCVYGYELPLAELFADKLLEKLNYLELNIVLCALVFEPRKNQIILQIPDNISRLKHLISPTIKTIRKKERRFRIFPLSKKPFFNLAPAMEKWSCGATLDEIRKLSDTDEGEIIRYFRMVIQILRQLKKIELISEEFKHTLQKSIDVINRNEVNAEKQLREGL